jgi:hypothetical protein
MEIKIDFDKKKIRIIGNIESKHFSILNDFLTRLYEEDEAFMIVNEVETSSPLKNMIREAQRTTTSPLDLINNPQPWVNPYRYEKKDPFEKPWKMTYDNNDSIDQSLFKVTCTACADTCTHQILNPNPNDKA